MKRLFVAAPIPDDLRAKIAEALARLTAIAPRARFVAPENLHLTLRFLGSIDDALVPEIAEALAHGLLGTPGARLAIAGGGSFGSGRKPRVLFLDLEGELDRLQAISDRVDAALDALGALPPRDRPLTPHLTLARARDPRGDPAFVLAREALADVRVGTLEIGEVILYESRPQPKGARYAPLARVPLATPG